MAHTNFIDHIVFSTKHRQPLINSDLMPRLVQYIGGLIRARKGALLAMNGTENHVHILAVLTPTLAICDQVRDIKSISSGWVKDCFPNLKSFAWQTSYGGFGVSPMDKHRVIRYIANQQEHHKKKTFEEEYIAMLDRAGIEYDPRYVFD